jgi:hypothetical protein
LKEPLGPKNADVSPVAIQGCGDNMQISPVGLEMSPSGIEPIATNRLTLGILSIPALRAGS